MAVHQDFEDLLRCLNDANVKYLLVGAHAVSFYTEPRYTKDIDIWVEPALDNAKKVLRVLRRFGAPVSSLKIEDLTNPKLVYQIGVEPVRIDILMGIEGVKFSDAWRNKKKTKFGKEKVFIIGIGDLMKSKKTSARLQDKLDLKKLTKAKKDY